MDRLRVAPDERIDNVHFETLMNGVEGLARSLVRLLAPTGTGGSGILAGTPAYDSGTGRVTIASMVAIDGTGNVVLPTGSVVSDPIAGGDVGDTPMYVWACIVPGSVQSAPGKRVRWASGAPQSFSTYTKNVDSIQAKIQAAQPAALTVTRSSGTESYDWFKAFSVASWDGGVPNLPTFEIVSPFALGGATAPGSVLGILQLVAAAVGGIKSSGGVWNDVVASTSTLAGLAARAAALELTATAYGIAIDLNEARLDAIDPVLDKFAARYIQVPLTGGIATSGSAVTADADGINPYFFGSWTYRIALPIESNGSSGAAVTLLRVYASVDGANTLSAKLASYTTAGVETVVGTVTWTPGDLLTFKDVFSGSYTDVGVNRRLELVFTGTTAGGAKSTLLHSGWIGMSAA